MNQRGSYAPIGNSARRGDPNLSLIGAECGPNAVSNAKYTSRSGNSMTYPHHRVLLRSKSPRAEKCRAGNAVDTKVGQRQRFAPIERVSWPYLLRLKQPFRTLGNNEH